MVLQSSQLRITVAGDPVQVRRGKNDGFWSLYERGSWEPDTQAVFRRFIDKQHSYIDIGAWIGPTLLLGCQFAKHAYGVEPDPVAYTELVENMKYNRPLTNNVQLFNICITPVSGKVSFGSRGDGGDSASSLLFSNEKTSWTVDGVNFQEWIEQNEINDCNFIKIDIEGGEYSVLPTMAAYLKNHRPTLHLSLHPCFLGELEVRGVKAKLKRSIVRLANTIRMLNTLRFYKYMHDPIGKVQSLGRCSLPSRIRHRLVKKSWKPVVLLVACLCSIWGHPSALVLTDQKWQPTAASPS
jgi:FkbM family methyltransferase